MNATEVKRNIGKKVLVHYKQLMFVGKLAGFAPGFNNRDVLVHFPGKAKPDRFYASKVEELKP